MKSFKFLGAFVALMTATVMLTSCCCNRDTCGQSRCAPKPCCRPAPCCAPVYAPVCPPPCAPQNGCY